MGLAKLGGCVVAATALLSGCWGQPGFGPANTRYNDVETTLTAANVAGLTEDWSTQVPAVSLGEPIVKGGRVYATASHPADFLGVRAFAANTGTQVWETQVAGVRGSAGPVTLSGDRLAISHSPGFCPGSGITYLDPGDGHELLFLETLPWGHEVNGGGIVADVRDDACEPFGPSTLVVRDAATSATLWTAVLPETNQPVVSDMTPTIAHGHIYVAAGSTLYAYDVTCPTTTCGPAWSHPFDGARLARVAGGPDGQVFVATTETLPTDTTPGEATMRALSATDGSQRWSLGFERIADVAVTPSHVYVLGNGVGTYGVMFAFSTTCASENGCVDWMAAWDNRKPTNIAAAGDVVYVTLGDPFPNQQPPHVPFGFLEAWPAAGCGDPICPDPPEIETAGHL